MKLAEPGRRQDGDEDVKKRFAACSGNGEEDKQQNGCQYWIPDRRSGESRETGWVNRLFNRGGLHSGIPGAEVHAAPQAAGPDQPGSAFLHGRRTRARGDSRGRRQAGGRREDAAQPGGKGPRHRRDSGRGLRSGSARAAAAGSHHQRHSGDHAASWSTWSAAANSTARRWSSKTTRTCCASSKKWCRAWAAAWTNRRRWWTPACPTARASTPPFRRWPWTGRCSPSAVSAATR